MAERKIVPEGLAAPNYVTCACAHCGGNIEFDANQLGTTANTTVPCPHCGLETTICVPNQEGASPPIAPIVRESETQGDAAIMEVLKWYRKAAEQGDAECQLRLGQALAGGCGVSQDYTEAAGWFLKAAEQGHPTAQFNMGACFWNGHGVAKDHAVGAEWLLKAATQGDPDAQKAVGQCYENADGVAQDSVEAYKWMKLAAAQNHAAAQLGCDELAAKLSKEQREEAERRIDLARLALRERKDPAQGGGDSTYVSVLRRFAKGGDSEAARVLASMHATEMKPSSFSLFIGQERVKARLELAVAAAKQRREALDHVLLVGPPGAGKTTLSHIIAKAMGAKLWNASGPSIVEPGQLADLLTNCEEGDVLFIGEIHRLQKAVEEYLYPAIEDFRLDIIIDQGSNARSVRLNLPRFTLIGTAPRREGLDPKLLSYFPIVEIMTPYSVEELASITKRFSSLLGSDIEEQAAYEIARSSQGTPRDVLKSLRRVQGYALVKSPCGKITAEIAAEAFKLFAPWEEASEPGEIRDAAGDRTVIPSKVRREVWRRDGGRCARCGSRERLEYDHIIPVTRGGSNTARNIELLCEACNRAKSDLIQ